MITPAHHPISYRKLLTLLALTFAALIGSITPAQALQFDFSYAPGTSLEQMIGFEMAGGIWSSYLADDITVKIYVGMTDLLPVNVVGGALPGIEAKQKYDQFEKKFSENVTSADDQLSFNNLQKTKKFEVMVNGERVEKNTEINITHANAKALGLLSDSNNNQLDGYILINNLANQPRYWDYDFLRSNNAPDNTVDFLSEGLHEIGHILGFVSGIDEPGWLEYKIDGNKKRKLKKIKNVTPLDMLRYSTQSAAAGLIDMSIGGSSFFSIDGGFTPLAFFSTGEKTSLGGDGYQASHWQNQSYSLGIMDPVIGAGERAEILAIDLRSLDAIGWELKPGGVDLASLHAQAKERLAQKLGVTVEWLDANPVDAPRFLTEDRSKDVEKMIEKSYIYEWGWGSGSVGWWQKAFFHNAYFTTIDSQPEAVSGLEPALTIGILGLGLLGSGSLLKRRGKKRRAKNRGYRVR